jgi:phytoene dehydrogenase-like protein
VADPDAVAPLRLPPADVIVVGSGPNGLAAAIACAQAGLKTLVVEQAATFGGGCRSAALTLPGFTHDVCSAIHPLGIASPFFSQLDLGRFGLTWIQPYSPLAHPFDDGSAAVLERSIADTAATLGEDGPAYRGRMGPLVDRWNEILSAVLAPLHLPHHPIRLARFGFSAARSARHLAESWFAGSRARGLFAGLAAHSFLSLDAPPSAAFGLVLAMAGHAVGWPMPRGGSQVLADALLACLEAAGGAAVAGVAVQDLDQLPPSRLVFLDVTPRQALRLAGRRLSGLYRRQLARYRYGPGVFKVDWALAGAIHWQAAACRRAGTVHLGSTLEEIAAAEAQVARGELPERPFVLLAQQSLFDPTRAPAGKHTAWAYCHVPNGSSADMTARIERQVERFAPGFSELILARHTRSAVELEAYNPNYVGGDISGGAMNWRQLFFRPAVRLNPYATGAAGLYLCSASTPPGGGVHGMCGYLAARAAISGCGRGG